MTWPGTEPRLPGPLANTTTATILGWADLITDERRPQILPDNSPWGFFSFDYFTQSARLKYYFTLWEFFAPALADGLSLKFECQTVSLSLQDSSQYSGRSQQCCSWDSLHSSSYFQVLQSLYQYFSNCTKAPITIGITVTFMFHSFSIL